MSDILNQVSKLGSALAALQRAFLFLLMSILTSAMLAEIIARYFFRTSFFGMEQYVGYSAVWLYLIGASYGSYERTHIKAEFINIIVSSPRKRSAIRAFAGMVSVAMSVVFARWSWEFCMDSLQMQETTPTGGIPMIVFQSALFVGAVLMIIYFLSETIDYTLRTLRPR